MYNLNSYTTRCRNCGELNVWSMAINNIKPEELSNYMYAMIQAPTIKTCKCINEGETVQDVTVFNYTKA